MVHTHVGRVVAHIEPDGSTDYSFVPVDAPNRRLSISRRPAAEISGPADALDLRRHHGQTISVTGLRNGDWITSVISIQALPERPPMPRVIGHEPLVQPV